ncbi:MAG: restriction endonuclease subunit S [Gammaproteobacteria bacterium]
MNLDTFFEKFDQFAGAPDAVQMMRTLIISFATSGKLVGRAAEDHAASTLVDIAGKERSAREKSKKIAKQRPLDPVHAEEAPYNLPAEWCWTRLGAIGVIFNGDSINADEKQRRFVNVGGRAYIATKDVGYGFEPIDYDNGIYIPESEDKFKVASANSTLICAEGGSAGRKCGITNRDVCFGNKLFCNEPLAGINAKYILYWYLSPRFLDLFDAVKTGIIGGVSIAKFIELPIPLPPLGEQNRIVAKADELMALCDRLETQQQERDTRHAALARASLTRFADAPTPANLQFLFHKSYDIVPADLRKSILTLALQGKLVSQDSGDEPSEAILGRILAEDHSKKGSRQISPTADLENIPFRVPNGWSIARLGSILDPKRGISYGVIKLGAEPQQGGVFILRCSNVRFRKIDLNGIRKVTEQLSSEYGRTILRGGEVLINVRGTLGGCAVVPPELKGYNVAREVAVIPVHSEIDPIFVMNVIASPYFQDKVSENLRGIAYSGLNLGLLRDFPIPIPPLAEQRRIVARVDRLMALVDDLEAQLAASRATAKTLHEAVVAELTVVGAPSPTVHS